MANVQDRYSYDVRAAAALEAELKRYDRPPYTTEDFRAIARTMLDSSQALVHLNNLREQLDNSHAVLRRIVETIVTADPDEMRKAAAEELQKKADKSEELLRLMWDSRQGWSHRRDPFVGKHVWAKVGEHLFGEGSAQVAEMTSGRAFDGTLGTGKAASGDASTDNPILMQANLVALRSRAGRGVKPDTVAGIINALHANGLIGNQQFPVFTGDVQSTKNRIVEMLNTAEGSTAELADSLIDAGLVNVEAVDVEKMSQQIAQLQRAEAASVDSGRFLNASIHQLQKIIGEAAGFPVGPDVVWPGNVEASRRLRFAVAGFVTRDIDDVHTMRAMIEATLSGGQNVYDPQVPGSYRGNQAAQTDLQDLAAAVDYYAQKSRKLKAKSRKRKEALVMALYQADVEDPIASAVTWKGMLEEIAEEIEGLNSRPSLAMPTGDRLPRRVTSLTQALTSAEINWGSSTNRWILWKNVLEAAGKVFG
jgi:hypothetical protein